MQSGSSSDSVFMSLLQGATVFVSGVGRVYRLAPSALLPHTTGWFATSEEMLHHDLQCVSHLAVTRSASIAAALP
jgi:hypothetical protein